MKETERHTLALLWSGLCKAKAVGRWQVPHRWGDSVQEVCEQWRQARWLETW